MMENLKLVALSIILWGDIGAHGVAFSTEQQQQKKKTGSCKGPNFAPSYSMTLIHRA